MSEKTKIAVKIFGNEYTIKGEASPEYIQKIANYVDEKIREIAQVSPPTVSATKIAILAAVNIADELFTLQTKVKSEEEGINIKATELINKIKEEIQ